MADEFHPAPKARACPICGKPSVAAVLPFCSPRCADVDLHRWFSGHYAVPVSGEDEALDETLDEPDRPSRAGAATAMRTTRPDIDP